MKILTGTRSYIGAPLYFRRVNAKNKHSKKVSIPYTTVLPTIYH